jgi:hypothetical protein
VYCRDEKALLALQGSFRWGSRRTCKLSPAFIPAGLFRAATQRAGTFANFPI